MKEISVIEVTVKPGGKLEKTLKVLKDKKDKDKLKVIENYKNGLYDEYFNKLKQKNHA